MVPSRNLGMSAREILYTEIAAFSHFSLLEGASSPEEIVHTANVLGYRGISITDRDSLSGVVRANSAAQEISESQERNFSLLIGATIDITSSTASPLMEEKPSALFSLIIHPTSIESYGNLSELLTLGKSRTKNGRCSLTIRDIEQFHEGLIFTVLPHQSSPKNYQSRDSQLRHLRDEVGELYDATRSRSSLFSLALFRSFTHLAASFERAIVKLSNDLRIPLVATNIPLAHSVERKPLHDILTCIRHGKTLQQAGFLLEPNRERHLKQLSEISRLFSDLPSAITRTEEIRVAASRFSLNQLTYEYPHEVCPPEEAPSMFLRRLTQEGALSRFPNGVPLRVQSLIDHELTLIHELKYEHYFLTCYDIVRFARSRSILCQGRGAAANSAVCYCLGITSVNPVEIDLLFARFISKERNEPPDIDIDFEHERREEVMQYIYEKYGRERAALTCEIVTYRYRSAIRDVGKAIGLPNSIVESLAKRSHRWTGGAISTDDLQELGLQDESTPIRNTLLLAEQLLGFPRHLSQHVGGFIISEKPLNRIVPIRHATMEGRTIIEWNKDDIEELGILKIDILALGMLSCIRKAFAMINHRRARQQRSEVALHSLPRDDAYVYEMIQRADTIGVFQIESRAQMSMLPRLRPRCFYDLVIEVAIVRPGPIQGNMVHPYLRRRQGKERVSFPDPRVRSILGKTLGVPIFQEQAMRLAIELADFSPGDAEKLRRAMAAWRRKESLVAEFVARITEGMRSKGYSDEFIEQCCRQLRGFSEYGFPESHAASFALLVYASAWIKRYYPAEFAAALINSQPMGFYPPAQILEDAKRHGVQILPIDVNYSSWNLTVLPSHDASDFAQQDSLSPDTIRLGLRLIKGLSEGEGSSFPEAVRSYGKFVSMHDLWGKVRLVNPRITKEALKKVAAADGLRSLGLTQREALWEIHALPATPLPLLRDLRTPPSQPSLPGISREEATLQDYAATGVSLRAHPLEFLRSSILQQGGITTRDLRHLPEGAVVAVAGLVLFRQRPGTANGVIFLTLEDEWGMSNLIITSEVFANHQRTILHSDIIFARGKLQKIGPMTYISVTALTPLSLESATQDSLFTRADSIPQ
jgi:error-prone DNA polymerase